MSRLRFLYRFTKHLMPSKKKLVISCCLGTGWWCVNYLPNTHLMHDAVKVIFFPVDVRTFTPKTEQIYHQAVADLNAVRSERIKTENIKCFIMRKEFLELMHKGRSDFPQGAVIAMPILYCDVADPVFRRVRNITLSDSAKRFAIARELLYVESNPATFRFLLGLGLTCFFPVVMSVQILIPIYIMFAAALYFTVMGSVHNRLDSRVDKQLASLGAEYRRGGLEYYDAVIQDNLWRKEKLGANITDSGNENEMLVSKHKPVVSRRDFFRTLVDKDDELETQA